MDNDMEREVKASVLGAIPRKNACTGGHEPYEGQMNEKFSNDSVGAYFFCEGCGTRLEIPSEIVHCFQKNEEPFDESQKGKFYFKGKECPLCSNSGLYQGVTKVEN